MEPPSCTVLTRSVRTTVAVAIGLLTPGEAGLPWPLLVAPAATAPLATARTAITTARLENKTRLAENLAIGALPGSADDRSRLRGPVAGGSEPRYAGLLGAHLVSVLESWAERVHVVEIKSAAG
jgi:hypothetical protein